MDHATEVSLIERILELDRTRTREEAAGERERRTASTERRRPARHTGAAPMKRMIRMGVMGELGVRAVEQTAARAEDT